MKKVVGVGLAVVAAAIGLVVGLIALVFAATANANATGLSLKGVPAAFQPWIELASQHCKYPELTPALLAAQLNQESHFSTSPTEISDKGAMGPAQFEPGSWATWGRDADGDGVADPFDVADAVTAQGRMMCSLIGQAKASGFPGDPRALALAGYNAGWGAVEAAHGVPPFPETQKYVTSILGSMKDFEATTSALQVTGSGVGPDALRKAAGEIGIPYSWGGGSPAGPSTGFCDGVDGYLGGHCVADTTVGFDCSSLTQYAFWPAVKLPRTAAEQYDATSDQPVAHADLQPGDLLFWSHGGDTAIYHVAIYAGGGQMVEAPRTGEKVKTASVSTMPSGDYYGATQP